jgi:hypothetical protein
MGTVKSNGLFLLGTPEKSLSSGIFDRESVFLATTVGVPLKMEVNKAKMKTCILVTLWQIIATMISSRAFEIDGNPSGRGTFPLFENIDFFFLEQSTDPTSETVAAASVQGTVRF